MASTDLFQFTAPLLGMWDEMQVNLEDHCIKADRAGDFATFVGRLDDIDCFISKHYDGTDASFVVVACGLEGAAPAEC